jgi:hypothetical protein
MFAAINSFLTGGASEAKDPYWANVSMLLHGDGTNAAQNNTFLDTSTNNFTVTRNGNTTQGSFNPFVSTYPYAVATNGGSAYFDGTGDWLSIPDDAAFTLGTNDFTIECWINLASFSGTYIAGQQNTSETASSFYIVVQTSGRIDGVLQNASSSYVSTNSSVGAIVANTWYHIAFVRNGNTTRLYINGVQAGTNSVTGFTVRDSAEVLGVGRTQATSGSTTGYISNFRLVNGTCLYPSGTTFTPPTAPLTAVTNTALLLGMSNAAIFDNAILNNLETVADAQISTSVFKYGTGSMKFDGTGDYLNTSPANQAAFAFGSGDFTIEMWVYAATTGTTKGLYDSRPSGTNGAYAFIYLDSSNVISYLINSGGGTITGTALSVSTWYHVAVARSGTSTKLFLNGVQVGSTLTDSNTYLNAGTSRPFIGANASSLGSYFNGYIDDLRVTKGIARYTATFTPPTAAFPNS